MSVYNDARYLRESLDSILQQTFADFEFIIYDDGSTDDTRAVLSKIQDHRVKVLGGASNKGQAYGLNRCIEASAAPYIARQDADDISRLDRLARLATFLKSNPDVVLVGSGAEVIDNNGRYSGLWDVPLTDIELRWKLLFCCPFIHSTAMFRRSAYDAAGGGYSESHAHSHTQDYELWSRLANIGRIANVPDRLLQYRINPTGVTSRHYEEQLQQIASQSLRNMQGVKSDLTDLDEANRLLRARPGDTDTEGMRIAVALEFLSETANGLYHSRSFDRAEVVRHARSLGWRNGKHLVALSVRARRATARRRLELLLVGARVALLGTLRRWPRVSLGSYRDRATVRRTL
jgi:hypothetical protein